jgi:phage recombination protein Bet
MESDTTLPTPAQPVVQFPPDQVELIRRTICKDATDDELAVFLHVCKRTGLDPILKQIYLVKRKGKMCVQVGIDGYRLVAERTGLYCGNDDPVFDSEEKPRRATVTIYKLVGSQRCPFTATARWDQYYPGDGDVGFMWRRMPHLMIGKCAEALALRKAFPAELGGTYTSEELDAPEDPLASPDQIGQINDAIEKCEQADRWGPDSLQKMLTVYKIETLADLPANRVPHLLADLDRQRKGMKKGGGQ